MEISGGKTCPVCGAVLAEDQVFCHKCGYKLNETNPPKKAGSKKKAILIIGIAALVLILAVVIAAVVLNPSVKEFKLDEDALTMVVDETHTVSYQIKPEKAAKKTVRWESSDENIAIVDEDGKITAKGHGNCTITAKAGKMTDSVSITIIPHVEEILLSSDKEMLMSDDTFVVSYKIIPVSASDNPVIWQSSDENIATVNETGLITAKKAGICVITVTSDKKTASLTVTVRDSFLKLYADIADKSWCTISPDGLWMEIDTNPDDIDADDMGYTYYVTVFDPCLEKIEKINLALGFSSALYKKMKTTTALQGKQTESNDKYTVTWSYHPDNGLEILYEIIP